MNKLSQTTWQPPRKKQIRYHIHICGSGGGLVAKSCLTPCDPMDCTWTVQAPLYMGFSRQECWSALPCPPPGHQPDLGIEPESLHVLHWQADSSPLSQLGFPYTYTYNGKVNSRFPTFKHEDWNYKIWKSQIIF